MRHTCSLYIEPQKMSLSSFLLWFQSIILSTRYVKDCSHSFQPLPLSCGVPQGSILDPLLFILFTTLLSYLENPLLLTTISMLMTHNSSYTSPRSLFPPQSHRCYSLW